MKNSTVVFEVFKAGTSTSIILLTHNEMERRTLYALQEAGIIAIQKITDIEIYNTDDYFMEE